MTRLVIFLAKTSVSDVADCIKEADAVQRQEVDAGGSLLGTFFYRTKPAAPPSWTAFFDSTVDLSSLRTASSSGVLVMQAKGRLFALCFGYGRSMVNLNAMEEDFGLIATLNSIDPNQIRSLDRVDLAGGGHQAREQATDSVPISDFGLDPERDLLRAVTASPKDTTLGRTVAGRDSLAITTDANVREVRLLLERCLKQYRKRTYKQTFPFVDNLQLVTSEPEREELDRKLVDSLNHNMALKPWLAPPGILEPERVLGFKYSSSQEAPVYETISIENFLGSVRPSTTISAPLLRQRHLRCVDTGTETEIESWPVYRCLNLEIRRGSTTYLLNNGKWYRVDTDFVATVNTAMDQIQTTPPLALPSYHGTEEARYNETASAPAHCALMDERNVPYGGGHSKIEFCDVYSTEGVLAYVKRGSSAKGLSHLFRQGVNAATLFVADPNFREALNEYLPPSHKLADPLVAPKASDHTIAYVVLDRAGHAPKLPFFAKLSLRHAHSRLQGYGYNVTFTTVPLTRA